MCENPTFLFDFDFNHPQCAQRTDPYPQQRSGAQPSPPICKTKLGSPAALRESRPTLRSLQFAPRVMRAQFHSVFTILDPGPARWRVLLKSAAALKKENYEKYKLYT